MSYEWERPHQAAVRPGHMGGWQAPQAFVRPRPMLSKGGWEAPQLATVRPWHMLSKREAGPRGNSLFSIL